MTTATTLIETLENHGLDAALEQLDTLEDKTPALLMKVAVCQDILHLMENERGIQAVKVTHLYAHGEATKEEYDAARAATWATAWTAPWAAISSAVRGGRETAKTAACFGRVVARQKQEAHFRAIVTNYMG